MSEQKSPPRFDKDFLVELGGWAVYREAVSLADSGAVLEAVWEAPVLRGAVRYGTQTFQPRLNLRSTVFAENKCSCARSKQGQVCAHALAACIQFERKGATVAPRKAATPPTPPPPPSQVAAPARGALSTAEALGLAPGNAEAPAPKEPEAEAVVAPKMKSLVVSEGRGLPLAFRIVLAPNLAQTAPKDAIMVKLEALLETKVVAPEKLDRGRAYRMAPPFQAVAGWVESWCGGKLHGMLQLTRDRLRCLLKAVEDLPVVHVGSGESAPLRWENGRIPQVHAMLEAKAAPQAAPGAAPAAAARTQDASRGAAPVEEKRRWESANAPSGMIVDGSTQFLSIQLPSKESVIYEKALGLVKGEGFQLEPTSRKWWLRDRHRVLSFLAKHWETLRNTYRAQFTDNFAQRTASLKFAELKGEAAADAAGFAVDVRLHAPGAAEDEVRDALARGTPYLMTQEGAVLIAPATVEKLAAAQRALSSDGMRPASPSYQRRLKTADLAPVESILEEMGVPLIPPEQWKARSGALKDISRLPTPPLPEPLRAVLRGYQKLGVAWLWHLFQNELAGILADEMGLGKTAQALALFSCLRSAGQSGPLLVVCPASLVENWRREARRFAPEIPVFVHHRENRADSEAALEAAGIVVTSYATLSRDAQLFQSVTWLCAVADEAQHVKNRQTQNARALRSLRARGRVVLTGTPIENSVEDLRSLFDFLMPGYLPRPMTERTKPDRDWQDEQVRRRAAPYILRRAKTVVAPELPEKIEQTVFCELEGTQAAIYRDVQEATRKAIFEMEMGGASDGRLRLAALNQLTRLRQVCADPRLLEPKAGADDSAKLRAFREILEEALDGGHRILVFSQFVSVLKLIQEDLEAQSLPFCYLDGQTRDRQAVCDRFNNDASVPVFLISLKAGGTGLNLTGADTVVHFDPWWNPAVEAQATDRAHRIGQTRVVTSYKLIAAGTVEEKVLGLQRSKATLLSDLFEASEAANARVSLADLKALVE